MESRSFTARAAILGTVFGAFICNCNVYFGLQIGYTSTVSNTSSPLGYAVFKTLPSCLGASFSPQENVLIQIVAGALGSMAGTAGFVVMIPALGHIINPEDGGPVHLSYIQLCLWSLGACFFGLLFAMILRERLTIHENLPFPGARATASLIQVLHSVPKDACCSHEDYDDASLSDDSPASNLLSADQFSPQGRASDNYNAPESHIVSGAHSSSS